jgi:8-oxo-dGTP pyrophosphatase MutT (NUDIX family)
MSMTNASDNPWKKLKSEIVYKNKWYSVRQDTVTTPDGKPGQYNVVEALDGAFVIALDSDDNIQLIRKYRYPTNVYSLEVPAGGIEPNEDPLDGAKRELQEELGLAADTWMVLGKFQAENAYINNFGHVFIATDLSDAGKHDRLAEGINKTEKVSIREALLMIKSGEITDSQSISALTLLALSEGYLE